MAIADADKLSIYNGALRRLGSRKLASLAESREPRRIMDDIWDSGAVVDSALEMGEWNFALRSVSAYRSGDVEPPFGFTNAFDKPEDFRRLASLCADDRFTRPLTNNEYVDEAGYWFADYDTIYIRYVSGLEDYGFNSARWTEGFKDYLKAKMAWEACEAITNSTAKRDRQERDMGIALRSAKSRDAMNEGSKSLPRGSWVRAKAG